MGDFVNRLRELGVEDDSCVTLSYSEGCEVWHINESHVQESVAETETAAMVAGLLASGVPVYGSYGDPVEGSDILNEMRAQDVLDDYDRGDECFEDYLTEKLQETIYEGEYSIEYSTEQYDYKRGRCEISAEVRVLAGDLYAADVATAGRFQFFEATSFVRGFSVSVKTENGTLTLD
tara:strand:- start:134 stop:664 length:531 start_codon:yes stop_codon:yes gene_type:complete